MEKIFEARPLRSRLRVENRNYKIGRILLANHDATTGDLHYADRLPKAADALRGQVDAAEYKHVVLGLLFLKYISDSFENRRDELRAELTRDGIMGEPLERLLESRDEYTAERPRPQRWEPANSIHGCRKNAPGRRGINSPLTSQC